MQLACLSMGSTSRKPRVQQVLEEDESLRQPTRSWFDATPRTSSRPLLAGVDAAALPEAIDEYLAAELGGAEEEEEEASPISTECAGRRL